MSRRTPVVAAFVCLSLASRAAAQPPETSPSAGTPPAVAAPASDAAQPGAPSPIGDGWRPRLDAHGVTLGAATTSDLSAVHNSAEAGASFPARILFDVNAAVDISKLARWRGASAFVQYYANAGRNGAASLPAVQGFSNIDADTFHHFGEVWLEQTFAPGMRLKAGRVDANSEFAGVDSAADFLNPSMGYSPTVMLFPTYPDPRMSVNAAFDPSPRAGARVGVYDAGGGARFAIVEGRAAWSLGTRHGSAKLGLWRHGGDFAHLDGCGTVVRGAVGPYATIEQTIWGRDTRQVVAFAQFGRANPLISEIDRHASASVLWRGPRRGRIGDAVGFGVTRVHLSKTVAGGRRFESETIVGGFYSYRLRSRVRLEPDVQYIVHASAGRVMHTHLAVTYRVRTEF